MLIPKRRAASVRPTHPCGAVPVDTRLYAVEVWLEMGLPVEETREIVMSSEIMREFQKMLFSKVVPNCKRLGLLTPWLRERFHELDILRWEHEAPSA